jgi:hypothetical protein
MSVDSLVTFRSYWRSVIIDLFEREIPLQATTEGRPDIRRPLKDLPAGIRETVLACTDKIRDDVCAMEARNNGQRTSGMDAFVRAEVKLSVQAILNSLGENL